jgi:hypothetical protein
LLTITPPASNQLPPVTGQTDRAGHVPLHVWSQGDGERVSVRGEQNAAGETVRFRGRQQQAIEAAAAIC